MCVLLYHWSPIACTTNLTAATINRRHPTCTTCTLSCRTGIGQPYMFSTSHLLQELHPRTPTARPPGGGYAPCATPLGAVPVRATGYSNCTSTSTQHRRHQPNHVCPSRAQATERTPAAGITGAIPQIAAALAHSTPRVLGGIEPGNVRAVVLALGAGVRVGTTAETAILSSSAGCCRR